MSLHNADSSVFIDSFLFVRRYAELMGVIESVPIKAGNVNEQERQETIRDNHGQYMPYPLVALKNMVVFPRTRITLSMAREKSIRAVEEAMMQPGHVLVAASQLDPDIDDPEPKDIYPYGTLVEITTMHRQQDGNFQVVIHGLLRVRLEEFLEQEPFLRVAVSELTETKKGFCLLVNWLLSAEGCSAEEAVPK